MKPDEPLPPAPEPNAVAFPPIAIVLLSTKAPATFVVFPDVVTPLVPLPIAIAPVPFVVTFPELPTLLSPMA
ncbi:hypothetical protein [Aquirhabdus parva]|uniref:hypothetical protein n=1 Tax=Aquirhabdus parva TaxID=2283318 RepID=UPI0013B441A2|nr:hypothetical protein [Aquirhabdus parva]